MITPLPFRLDGRGTAKTGSLNSEPGFLRSGHSCTESNSVHLLRAHDLAEPWQFHLEQVTAEDQQGREHLLATKERNQAAMQGIKLTRRPQTSL